MDTLPAGTRVLGLFRRGSELVMDGVISEGDSRRPREWYLVTGAIQYLTKAGKLRSREGSWMMPCELTAPHTQELYDKLIGLLRKLYENKQQRKADFDQMVKLLER